MNHQLFTSLAIIFSSLSVNADPGTPLILTPLINSGCIEEARNLSRVGVLKDGVDVQSYSGYFTVDNETDSNLFFWFFPAETNYSAAPVIVWLQGGPGWSSLVGLFTEHGPYIINTDKKLKNRQVYWSQKYNVIYFDSPVGTGFSYTRSGYSRNETHVGQNLYNAVIQFLTLFPELREIDFFVSGESYAGKYVPALAYTIHVKNPSANVKINLQGLAIGNGICDPENMMVYGDYLYQLGIIDISTREYFHEQEAEIVDLIKQQKFEDAYWVWENLIGSNNMSYFYNITKFAYHYNFLYNDEDPIAIFRFEDFVQQDYVRPALHVGSNDFNLSSVIVSENLRQDFMQSVRPWLEILLEHYRLLLFSGQLDIIVPYPATVNFLQRLQWSGSEEYKTAERHKWYVSDGLAGYFKTAGNLTEVLVRNAGHLVPASQPTFGMDLITRFIKNQFYNSN